MKEEINIQEKKPFSEMTAEERKQINGFTDDQHAELKARYGNRLRHVTVQVDEDERYDYLIVRPTKDVLLAVSARRDDLNAANELMINSCVVAGNREALEDASVYTSVISAIGNLIKGQAAFIRKA